MTLKDIPKPISSPESEGGRLPSASPDGPMTDLFGQAVVLVSRSRQQGLKSATQTSATYGRIGLGSSGSAALQRSLGNKLQERLPSDGWMKSLMIWKRKRTPALREYCQLAVSAHRISGTDCGLWHTPRALMIEEKVEKFVARMGDRCNTTCPNLAVQVNPAFWQTPVADDSVSRKKGKFNSRGEPKLSGQVNMTMWPTPRSSPNENRQQKPSPSQLAGKHGLNLAMVATQASNGLNAQTEKHGQLNPEFVFWLMGFPTEWLASRPVETPSKLKSQRNL